jgi:hypothetical protein
MGSASEEVASLGVGLGLVVMGIATLATLGNASIQNPGESRIAEPLLFAVGGGMAVPSVRLLRRRRDPEGSDSPSVRSRLVRMALLLVGGGVGGPIAIYNGLQNPVAQRSDLISGGVLFTAGRR